MKKEILHYLMKNKSKLYSTKQISLLAFKNRSPLVTSLYLPLLQLEKSGEIKREKIKGKVFYKYNGL